VAFCQTERAFQKKGYAGQLCVLRLRRTDASLCVCVCVCVCAQKWKSLLFRKTPKILLNELLSLTLQTAETLCPQLTISAPPSAFSLKRISREALWKKYRSMRHSANQHPHQKSV